MSKCGECYYNGKELNPCNSCGFGNKAKFNFTNADRIRQMTDEELAELFVNFKNTFGEEYEGEMSCLEWLRKEMEEKIDDSF